MALPSPVPTYHTKSYPTISPTLPSLSQKGKNVFVSGATSGIGREIALSFAKADVTNLAVLGRRQNLLEELKAEINKSSPGVTVHIYAADLTDLPAVEKAFSSFASASNGPIHTLIANAGWSPGFQSIAEATEDQFRNSMMINVVGTRNSVVAWLPHISKEKPSGSEYRAQLIHTSTGAAHTNMPTNSTYSIGKVAAHKYMEFTAVEHPDIQVISFHPGLLKTEMAMAGNVDESTMGIPFDDISLPADWAVWAATNESSFLGSGRLVWAHWDVTELKEKFDKMNKGEIADGVEFGPIKFNKNFTLGLLGWPVLA